MQSLKIFLLNHGEKALLLFVILICGYAISARMRVSPYELTMPDGTVENVDPGKYRAQISEVKDILQSEGFRRQKPQARRVARSLANRIVSGAAAYLNLSSEEWYAYVQPTPIGIPQSFREIRAEDSGGVAANIPPEFRTRLGNPEKITVRAALGQVVVSARDSSLLNFPQPGSRRMLLYRKAIGSPKDGLAADLRARMQVSPHPLLLLPVAPTETPKDDAKAADTLGDRWTQYRNRDRGTPPPAPIVEPKPAEAFNLDQYKALFTKEDLIADQELVALTGNNDGLLLESAWELVTDEMFVLRGNELTEEDYEQLFTQGITPALAEMTPAQLAEYRARHQRDDAKKEPETAAPVVASQVASRRQRIDDLSSAEKPASSVPAENALRPQTYFFIDSDVKENMVYRYAVIAAVKPQFPNEPAVLDQVRSQNWDIYCELAGVDSVGSFAPPQRILAGVLYEDADIDDFSSDRQAPPFKKTIFTKNYGVTSPHLLDYIKPAYDDGASLSYASAGNRSAANNQNGPAAKNLRNEKNRLTPLGWAYKNLELCFSDFVSSGLVVTPQEYDFELQAVIGMPNDPMARVELFKTTPTGDLFSSSSHVRPPELARALTARDLLAKNAQGKVIEPVVLLPLVDVYNTPEMLRIRPVQIGGRAYAKRITAAADREKKSSTAAREDIEFTPNWGLIEIRPYKVRQKIYSLDRRGEWKVTSENFLPSLDPANNYYSLIIGEIKLAPGQQRRVRRLYRPLAQKPDAENKRYEYEYIWEFDIYQKALERAKRLGETAN